MSPAQYLFKASTSISHSYPSGLPDWLQELLGDFGHFLARFDASLFEDHLSVTERQSLLITQAEAASEHSATGGWGLVFPCFQDWDSYPMIFSLTAKKMKRKFWGTSPMLDKLHFDLERPSFLVCFPAQEMPQKTGYLQCVHYLVCCFFCLTTAFSFLDPFSFSTCSGSSCAPSAAPSFPSLHIPGIELLASSGIPRSESHLEGAYASADPWHGNQACRPGDF